MARPYRQDEDRDNNFERNRDYGRGYRGRSQHRDYDPENAGYDRAGDRAQSRTGRIEDVPSGRWEDQPGGYSDADAHNEGGYARSGRPDDDFLDRTPPRHRGDAPDRNDYQSDDFDIHSYGRYQGRHHGGSAKGQRQGPTGPPRGEGEDYGGYGRNSMSGRNYARSGYERGQHQKHSQPGSSYGSGDRNRSGGATHRGGRDYDMDVGFDQDNAPGPSRQGPHVGRGPKGYLRSPERIREDICESMTAHGYLDAREIEIEVDEDEVTLRGQVPDRHAKRLADDLAASVRGVHDVHNRLTLPPRQSSADDEDEAD